ncbi:MAG: PilZ domain-containing protein [Myxococcota bacterium]
MKSKKDMERRRDRRREVAIPVRLIEPNEHIFKTSDVSGGGMYCPFAGPRSVGEWVKVEIDLMNETAPTVVRARVVHSGRGPEGIGVSFAFEHRVPELAAIASASAGFEEVTSAF